MTMQNQFTQNSRTAFIARDGRIVTLNPQGSISQIDVHFVESTDATRGQGEGRLPQRLRQRAGGFEDSRFACSP